MSESTRFLIWHNDGDRQIRVGAVAAANARLAAEWAFKQRLAPCVISVADEPNARWLVREDGSTMMLAGARASLDPFASTPQPPPIEQQCATDVQSLVIADIAARREFGISKYGTPLQANNGRDALTDAYQEALDLACYLRQAIAERDGG